MTAYAGGDEYISEPEVTITPESEEAVEVEPDSAVPVSSNPFTPDGTGTVLDNATDGDGKEFFTITTPDENVYYLIIDRQKDTNNVYFLNAVTEADLLPLAEKDGSSEAASGSESAVPTPVPEPETPGPEPEVDTEPAEPEKSGSGGRMIFIILAVVVIGGAGYYFKILRPKQRAALPDDDYELDEEYEEYDADSDSFDSGFDYDEDDIPFDDDRSDVDVAEDDENN